MIAAIALAALLATEPGDEDAFPKAGARYESRLLPAGTFDLRVGALSDILLSRVSGVLAADRGIAPIGAGSLALGLELGAGKCLLQCGRISPQLVVDRLTLAPAARVTYHLPIQGGAPNLAATGFYALLIGGAAFDFVDETTATGHVRATTYSPFVSAGVGTTYFPGNSDEIFAGGEARLTYMPRFTALSVNPPQTLLQPQSLAPLPGLSLVFFMGARL